MHCDDYLNKKFKNRVRQEVIASKQARDKCSLHFDRVMSPSSWRPNGMNRFSRRFHRIPTWPLTSVPQAFQVRCWYPSASQRFWAALPLVNFTMGCCFDFLMAFLIFSYSMVLNSSAVFFPVPLFLSRSVMRGLVRRGNVTAPGVLVRGASDSRGNLPSYPTDKSAVRTSI